MKQDSVCKNGLRKCKVLQKHEEDQNCSSQGLRIEPWDQNSKVPHLFSKLHQPGICLKTLPPTHQQGKDATASCWRSFPERLCLLLQQNDPDAAGGSSVSGFSAGLFQFYILFQASAYYMDSIHVSIPNVLEHEQPLEYSSIVKIQYVQN